MGEAEFWVYVSLHVTQGQLGERKAHFCFFFFFFFFKDFVYLFMRDTEREAETQAEGEAGSMQGARCGTRSQDPRVTPWAVGRRSTTEPPGCPWAIILNNTSHCWTDSPVHCQLVDGSPLGLISRASLTWTLMLPWCYVQNTCVPPKISICGSPPIHDGMIFGCGDLGSGEVMMVGSLWRDSCL